MEARKITIVSTRNQKKSVIMSAATTLSELKEDLRQSGIDYDGMTFYEGTSKVELKDNNSVLPHDVPYKGTTTNELVFMLTNTNKKIRSGADMNRAEAYAAIKANNLQSECVKRFGKNFTMCKTVELEALVKEKTAEAAKPTKTIKTKATKAKEEAVKSNTSEAVKPEVPVEVVDIKARAAISKLLNILEDSCTIDLEELEVIESILNDGGIEDCAPKNASSYSDAEIDEMFNFIK